MEWGCSLMRRAVDTFYICPKHAFADMYLNLALLASPVP